MFQSSAIPPGFQGVSFGNKEDCPRCGNEAEIENSIEGVPQGWQFIVEARRVLANSTPTELRSIERIARAASEGRASTEQAAKEAAEVSAVFARLLTIAKEWQLLPLFVAILGVYLTWAASRPRENIQADEVLDALNRQAAAQERIADQLEELNRWRNQVHPSRVQPPHTALKAAPTNRHERRRRSALKGKPLKGPPRL